VLAVFIMLSVDAQARGAAPSVKLAVRSRCALHSSLAARKIVHAWLNDIQNHSLQLKEVYSSLYSPFASKVSRQLRIGFHGACGLLFCAAMRSGAFSLNMPAGLRARVSRLGGFTRPFSG
jgi:hypothetical protein